MIEERSGERKSNDLLYVQTYAAGKKKQIREQGHKADMG